MGWRCENLGLIHKPYTRYWALFTHHYWVFSGNAYFWNNSSLKFGVEEYATPHGYQKSRWYLPWCNFERFQSQVKSHYFSERIDWGSVDCCFSFRKNTCVAVKLQSYKNLTYSYIYSYIYIVDLKEIATTYISMI